MCNRNTPSAAPEPQKNLSAWHQQITHRPGIRCQAENWLFCTLAFMLPSGPLPTECFFFSIPDLPPRRQGCPSRGLSRRTSPCGPQRGTSSLSKRTRSFSGSPKVVGPAAEWPFLLNGRKCDGNAGWITRKFPLIHFCCRMGGLLELQNVSGVYRPVTKLDAF